MKRRERKGEITEVMKKGRSSLDSLPQLKAYLQEQIDQRSYDFEANLALLKIFQFNPSHIDIDVVQKVLIKALMNLPHMDFPLSLYVLPEAAVCPHPVSVSAPIVHHHFHFINLHFLSRSTKMKALPP